LANAQIPSSTHKADVYCQQPRAPGSLTTQPALSDGLTSSSRRSACNILPVFNKRTLYFTELSNS